MAQANPLLFQLELADIEQRIKLNELEHIELVKQQSRLLEIITNLEKKQGCKPEGYEQCIQTLSALDSVTERNLRFQADKLGISVTELKILLYNDGVYDELNL